MRASWQVEINTSHAGSYAEQQGALSNWQAFTINTVSNAFTSAAAGRAAC